MEFEDKVKEIKEKVGKTSLYIGRVPEKTKTEFKELAEAEFENDFGMTLKWLLDFRAGLLSSPNQILSEQINILAGRIAELENKQEQPKGIKTVSGKRLNRKTEEVDKNEQISVSAGQSPKV